MEMAQTTSRGKIVMSLLNDFLYRNELKKALIMSTEALNNAKNMILAMQQEKKKSSQWQRVPESWSDLEDGNYYMYGKIHKENPGGWPYVGYETILATKCGNSILVKAIPDYNDISIEPTYFMKAKEWPKPPAKEGQHEKNG